MKLISKNITPLLSSVIALSLLSPVAMADDSPTNTTEAIILAISDLSFAQAQTKAAYTYQEDLELPKHQASASAAQIAIDNTHTENAKSSEKAIKQALSPMGDAVQAQSSSDGVGIIDTDRATEAKNKMANIATQLQNTTTNDTADDSLVVNYIHSKVTNASYQVNGQDADVLTSAEDPSLGNKQFDFNTFFGTQDYANVKGSEQAAQSFMDRLLGTKQSLYSKLLDLQTLSAAIRNANVNDASGNTAAQITRTLALSTNFQEIQDYVRKDTASRSAAQAIFTDVFNERKPIMKDDNSNADLNKITKQITGDAPIQNETTKQYAYPSALEMAQYDATNDLSDKDWYNSIATMSDANVARETLIMQKKLYRAAYQEHLDNEKIQLLLAQQALSSQNDASMTLLTQTKAVNDWVANLGDSDSIGSPDNTTSAAS